MRERDVLVLHGQPGLGSDWQQVVGELPCELRVAALDRPGYGANHQRAGGFAANARAVLAELDARGIERAVLVGHSYGGGVALAVTQLAPRRVEALVLLASVGPGCLTGWDRLLAAPVAGEICAMTAWWLTPWMARARLAGIARRLGRPIAGHEHVNWHIWGNSRHDHGPLWRSFLTEQRALVGELDDLTSALAGIRQPVLLLADPHDTLIPVRTTHELAALLPDSQLQLIGEAGHHLPRRAAVRIAQAIVQFLTALDDRPQSALNGGAERWDAYAAGLRRATAGRGQRDTDLAIAGEMIWLYSQWMADTELALQGIADPEPIPAIAPPSYLPDAGWVVTRYGDVRAVLSDPGYEVGAAGSPGPVGTISWLRASVSRFTNGDEHARRRAIAVRELQGLPPRALRADAERRAHAVIDAAAGAGAARLDVMAGLARRVPMAVLAARLGIADADRAADAVIVTAAGYFPGADAERERAADSSTAELVQMIGPADEETIVGKIALMVQGCDATAGLIGKAVRWALPPAAGNADCPTDAILAEVLRYDPPLRVSRRVSRTAAELAGCPVPAGSTMLLRVDSANRDPAVFAAAEVFDPGRADGSNLTFGYGLRPCPAADHALMIAAGVVQAVRDRCTAVAGPVAYEPPVNIRIPARLEVVLAPAAP